MASGLFHLVQQRKKMFGTVSPDARSQLATSNDQGVKGGRLYIPEDLKHILLSRLFRNRTDVPGFSTIVRAPEISVANVEIPV
jgi:hypothetical protein